MTPNEIEQFIHVWRREATKTASLLAALPREQYDFRPDPEGRSLGELAWHIAEGDAYVSYAIEQGRFDRDARAPGMERPRAVEALAPGYERVHRDAVERVRKLTPADLDRTLTFFTGESVTVRDLLWDFILLHSVHHRGQLSLLCRLAGGRPTPLFGPTRETYPVPKPAAAAAS